MTSNTQKDAISSGNYKNYFSFAFIFQKRICHILRNYQCRGVKEDSFSRIRALCIDYIWLVGLFAYYCVCSLIVLFWCFLVFVMCNWYKLSFLAHLLSLWNFVILCVQIRSTWLLYKMSQCVVMLLVRDLSDILGGFEPPTKP